VKKVVAARNIGFCFGVRRTVAMAEEILARDGVLHSIGDIVHNPAVMAGLAARGLRVADGPDDVGGGPFIIRSHGLSPRIVARLRERGVAIHDATCPFVRKLQRLVERLDRDGYFVIIIGDKHHPEVTALVDFARRVRVQDPRERHVPRGFRQPLAVVGQTTLSFDEYVRCARAVAVRKGTGEVRILDTVCTVTGRRQEEGLRLSRSVDCMLVLGGRKSSNTRKLCEACRAGNRNTFQVESLADLETVPFRRARKIGVTSGTSTSEDFIGRVLSHLEKNGYKGGGLHGE